MITLTDINNPNNNFYLRFTERASEDLERSTSYHDLEKYVGEDSEIDAEMEKGTDAYGQKIIVIDGRYHSVIGGLCGYMLMAATLEEAIDEVQQMTSLPYGNIATDKWTIFEGMNDGVTNVFGDGDIFRPLQVVHIA
jgi:hypothetical protein